MFHIRSKSRKSATQLPKATLESVEAHLASGNLPAAAVAIRLLHAQQPSPATLAAYRRIILLQMHHALDSRNNAEFERLLAQAESLGPDAPDWAVARAMLLARGGHLPTAMMLIPAATDDAARKMALGHAADYCILNRTYQGLPEEHHEDCKNVTLAFSAYERGDDAAARDYLQNLGLQSPFLDWKLLLRGLTAYSANNDPLAIENWKRLHPERIPWRLAALFRAEHDDAFAQSLPGSPQTWHLQRHKQLGSDLTNALQRLAREITTLGFEERHWKEVPVIWAELRKQHADLADRFQQCVYVLMAHFGDPALLGSYLRTFGKPADDPNFDRLRAMAVSGQLSDSLEFLAWERYVRWLEKHPAGWSENEHRRACAMVYEHIAELAKDSEFDGDRLKGASELIRKVMQELGNPHKMKRPGEYYELALRADPSAASPRKKYIEYLIDCNDFERAHDLLQQSLALDHDNVPMLSQAGAVLRKLGRYEQAAARFRRAAELNPLDAKSKHQAASCLLAAARQALAAGETDRAEAMLIDASVSAEHPLQSILHYSLRSTIRRKQGRNAEADELRSRCMAHDPLTALFAVNVDALLAKLPTVHRNSASKAYNAAMSKPQSLQSLFLLLACSEELENMGFDWRGRKTLSSRIEKLLIGILVAEKPAAANLDSVLESLETIQNQRLKQRVVDYLILRWPGELSVLLFKAKMILDAQSLSTRMRNAASNSLAAARYHIINVPPEIRQKYMPTLAELERRLEEFMPDNFDLDLW